VTKQQLNTNWKTGQNIVILHWKTGQNIIKCI